MQSSSTGLPAQIQPAQLQMNDTLQLGLLDGVVYIGAAHEAVTAGRHARAAEEVAAGRLHGIKE